MRNGTIYSANDKSLYDALNQKTVTNQNLRDLFLSRGIVASRDSSRRSLALHFSRIPHDFFDYQKLAEIFGSPKQHEKLTSRRITTTVGLSTFESSALDLKADLELTGATVKVSTAKGSRLTLEIKYQKLNFNKSEFRQIITKTVRISIEREGNDIVIHSPHNEDADEWIEKITKTSSEKSEETLEVSEIELSPSDDAKRRSKFFTELIKNILGHPLHDVTDVYISKPKSASDSDNKDDEDVQHGIHISKASLRGQGVLQSEELKLLEKKGFYISKIVWVCKSQSIDFDLFEFEAQFASPEDCTSFTYLPRGFYKHLEGSGHSLTRTGFSSDEEHRLGRLIESAARSTLTQLKGVENAKDQVVKN